MWGVSLGEEDGDKHRKEVLFLSQNALNTNETFKAIAKFLFSAKEYLIYHCIIHSVRSLVSSENHRSNIQSHKTSERFCTTFKWAQGLDLSLLCVLAAVSF